MFSKIKLSNCLLGFLGNAFLAFGIYNIHNVANITEGGVLGLTLLLQNWFNISPAFSGFILNSLCYLLGLYVLGKRFLLYSFIFTLGFSIFYHLFELFPPLFPEIANYPLLASILGALFVGIGAGICVVNGGASGGDDALAMAVSKLTNAPIQHVYLIFDIVILILSLSYIPLKKIAYSLITVTLSGHIIGIIDKKID